MISVMERLEAFKSQNPHFKAIMRPTYVSKLYRMKVEFLKKGSFSPAELEALVSIMQIAERSSSTGTPSISKSITSLEAMGVRVFGLDEPLVGNAKEEVSWDTIAGYDQQKRYDEANFEFCVTIFNMSGCEIDYDQVFQNRIIDLAQQVQEISSCDNDDDLSLEAKDIHIIDETETETTSVMHNIEAFEPQKPHFKVVMHHNNVSNQYRLSFPINHVRENLTIVSKKLKLILKRSVDEKWYNLRLNVYAKNNLAQVGSAGWGNFVRDNELHIGDACVFELVDPRTAMYKRNYEKEEKIEENDVSVEIIDEIKPNLNDVASVASLDDTLDSTHSSTDDEASSSFKSKGYDYISPNLKKKLTRKLDGITSQHPHFKRIMYPSNVRDQKKLRVPLEHASTYFPRKSKEIILKGPNGKSHHVRFYTGKACVEIIGGWRS
uniref:TF-B3 domain-containing protein n=1 Tax=Chenopodium quinoa TaxID=63459 RepID=A0A803LRE4_CHEQI